MDSASNTQPIFILDCISTKNNGPWKYKKRDLLLEGGQYSIGISKILMAKWKRDGTIPDYIIPYYSKNVYDDFPDEVHKSMTYRNMYKVMSPPTIITNIDEARLCFGNDYENYSDHIPGQPNSWDTTIPFNQTKMNEFFEKNIDIVFNVEPIVEFVNSVDEFTNLGTPLTAQIRGRYIVNRNIPLYDYLVDKLKFI